MAPATGPGLPSLAPTRIARGRTMMALAPALALPLTLAAACSPGPDGPQPVFPDPVVQSPAGATGPATPPSTGQAASASGSLGSGPATPGTLGPPIDAASAPAQRETDLYVVGLEAPEAAHVGQSASASVRLATRQGYHVNLEYPTAFRPASAPGTDPGAPPPFGLAGPRVGLGTPREKSVCPGGTDVCTAVYGLELTPQAAGDQRLAGEVAFSVCSPAECQIQKVVLATSITVR